MAKNNNNPIVIIDKAKRVEVKETDYMVTTKSKKVKYDEISPRDRKKKIIFIIFGIFILFITATTFAINGNLVENLMQYGFATAAGFLLVTFAKAW